MSESADSVKKSRQSEPEDDVFVDEPETKEEESAQVDKERIAREETVDEELFVPPDDADAMALTDSENDKEAGEEPSKMDEHPTKPLSANAEDLSDGSSSSSDEVELKTSAPKTMVFAESDAFETIVQNSNDMLEAKEDEPEDEDKPKPELIDVKKIDLPEDTAEVKIDLSEVVEALRAKLSESEKTARDFKEMLYRKAADLENTKRRTQKQVEQIKRYGTENVLKEFLPLVDDLERALEHALQTHNDSDEPDSHVSQKLTLIDGRAIDEASQSNDEADKQAPQSSTVETFIDGMRLVLKKFVATLARFGVQGFDSVGRPFDPQIHEAISQVDTTQYPDGTVVSEFLRGYIHNDRLMRPALVAVGRNPGQAAESEEPPPVESDEEEPLSEEQESERGEEDTADDTE